MTPSMTLRAFLGRAIFALLLLSSFHSRAWAFGPFGINASLGLGYGSTYSAGITTSGLGLVGRLGYEITHEFEVGLSYSNYPINGGYTSSNYNYGFVLADINYHLRVLHPLYIGIMVGYGFYTNPALYLVSNGFQTTIPASTQAAFTTGLRAGYDIPIVYGLSIGPEVRFSFMFGTSMSTNFQGYGIIKYTL